MAVIISLIIIGVHSLHQISLFKEIISFNVLHRSTAWQYQAIKQFDLYFLDKSDVKIITALPPFLVDAYQETEYRVLPLSQSQEFLQKKELVWGTDVPYENLMEGYITWLKQSKRLFISNAYITHQQSVIEDYEAYKTQFDLELVSSGCLDACNIYELHLKTSATH